MTAFHSNPTASTAGLLTSLAHALPRDARTLRRRAIALADRLAHPHDRALDRRAADVLAQLLDAADGELDGYAEADILDADFDR